MVDNMRAKEVRKKLASFRSLKSLSFSAFSESFSVGSNVLPSAWDYCVKGPEGMSIFIRYSEFRNQASVLVSISKAEESESLRVVEWLRNKGRQEEADKFLIENIQQNGMALIMGAMDLLDNLFCSELSGVLSGKSWEDTPFDWGSYR